ncbi:MAG: patatin-like phospholipase family protein [Caloramator sp.]|nr:patatin-like phospholipase family protein [Caloramator sp.]
MYVDAVFEGGGVKGIAFLGAIKCLEERGYKFNKVAGTSAGAIVASLIAAGYSADELKQILFNFDFTKFQDKDLVQSIPLIGGILGLVVSKGIYSGDKFERWLKSLLEKKGRLKFKDFIKNDEPMLKIIASDITKKDIVVLPDDLKEYGIDPLEFEVAKAVRMSMSIPLYFKPVKLKVNEDIHYIVDGGILSNFPVWIFDVDEIPRWPTFGFKLQEPAPKSKKDYISLKDYIMDIVNTMLEENELRYIKNKDFVRTILIPTLGVNTTDFSISNAIKQKLYMSGYNSAKNFLETWNFEEYVRRYRMK